MNLCIPPIKTHMTSVSNLFLCFPLSNIDCVCFWQIEKTCLLSISVKSTKKGKIFCHMNRDYDRIWGSGVASPVCPTCALILSFWQWGFIVVHNILSDPNNFQFLDVFICDMMEWIRIEIFVREFFPLLHSSFHLFLLSSFCLI